MPVYEKMSIADILDRALILKGMHSDADRNRIRSVMNGGAEGVQAVLARGGPGAPIRTQGSGTGKGSDSSLGIDLPTANIMFSGLERLAQKIGRPPVIKTDMIPTRDNETARKKAEKRARIVSAWDDISRIEMQYPQIGRWLPGYGFTFHNIRERSFGDTTYPVAELRDPYDVYPGMWGVDQQPTEAAVYRQVSQKAMGDTYPEVYEAIKRRMSTKRAGVPIIGQTGSWEGNPHSPVTLIEYYNEYGCYVVCPEVEAILSFIPNPLESGPAFVMTKRFSFDKLQSQYHHVFGLMAMMAKLNILGLIGVEDSTFRETNIIGDMVGNTYERGRFAVNKFEPGTRIEKPTSDQLQQVWQAVGIVERQFRIVAGYDVAQDGQSPNSFATGQGIRELGSAAAENVKEYQTAIKHSMELIDRKRLEWEEKMHPTSRKRVYWFEGGTQFEEHYVPNKDIDKDYRTKRIYGAMATFDENSKIVAGLQLVQARIMDRRTMQENMDGFDNPSLINERIDQDMAKEQMIQGLGQRFAERDPAAEMALTSILDKPSDTNTTLKKLFTPEEPQMSPEEMAMMQGGGQQGIEGGPPPAVQTILAQMEAEGGGVQSVGQMG
jgi:hypothetical protein